ncbi:ArsR family transcriptional regulator [Nocardioides zeae]|uniref:ArsR family transcriptional regulator n=1 Tax=Nocardioides zeae TaxID=1457234 RepID=A0ACC6IK91_9ACTN|nr:metalloregulator ArsR/SmtB family transcription factor [Nocardioides zeae]MDR6173706.1 ArsR family transcriptional regulator [Nocardioides zeae]MDR6211109.1 ArsR family transcriptional regulator [Nocardioides zeae]
MQTVAACFDICQYPQVTTAPAPACCTPSPDALPGLDEEAAAAAAVVLKALADPVRLRLYSRIAGAPEPVCVCDIDDVGVSQPTVSHHLRKLREAGLIDCERRGTWVYYWPVPDATEAARGIL